MFLRKSLLNKNSAITFLSRQRPRSRAVRHIERLTGENLEHRTMLSVSPDWLVTAPDCGANWVSTAVGGPDGDVYVAGDFQGSVDFGGQVLTSAGEQDIFVARYSATGNLIWANAAGGVARDAAYGIDADTAGNAYVTGTFTETATFGTEELTGPGPTGVFVTKLDADGNFGWAATGGGDSINAGNTGFDVVAGNNGASVYVTGAFRGQGQFGDQTVNSKRANDGFVSELNAATGQFLWTKTVEGRGGAVGYGIALDDTDPNILYVTGAFDTVAEFDGIQLKAREARHFVAKMDTSGNYLWARAIGNDGWMVRGTVHGGNLYVTGAFEATADFGGIALTSVGDSDIYIVKVLPNGDVDLVQQAGGVADDGSVDIVSDAQGSLFVTGTFADTVNIGGQLMTSGAWSDGLIAQLRADDLTFTDSWQVGGESKDVGTGVATDATGNVYAAGGFRRSANFPTGDVATGTVRYGMYLLRFSPTTGQNHTPVADAGADLHTGDEDVPTAFDASGSSDEDIDQTLTYVWDFGDGSSATTVDPATSVDHAYRWGGTFNVTLTVNDGNGGFATDTTTAIVTEVNDTPVADPGGPYSANIGTTVTFDGSDSYDPDNEDGTPDNDQTLTFAWDFGDGATATGIVVNHTYDTADDYGVTLTVTDTGNDSGGSSIIVPIAEASAALTIDDGDLGYREVGYNNDTPYVPWLDPASGDGGYAGLDGVPDYRIAASKRSSCPKGPGQFICESFAYWDFAGLPAGPYEVLTTSVAQADNATRAPFAVIDTDAAWLFKTNKVDQTKDS